MVEQKVRKINDKTATRNFIAVNAQTAIYLVVALLGL
jgi:hypothetical protein